MQTRRKSSPNGVIRKPIALRLTPDEQKEIKGIESNLNISKAEFARQAYRAGKKIALSNIQNQGASSWSICLSQC